MSDLVKRLSTGEHPVELTLRPERTLDELQQSLARGYVHVKFTGTRGGTELSVPIDREHTDLSAADLDQGSGRLRVVGDLTLDYVKVRCIADIELPSMSGSGHLVPLDGGAEAAV